VRVSLAALVLDCLDPIPLADFHPPDAVPRSSRSTPWPDLAGHPFCTGTGEGFREDFLDIRTPITPHRE
jgi:hypothetical protein